MIKLVREDGALEVRHIRGDWFRPNVATVLDGFELVADDDHDAPVMWVDVDWIEADVASGGWQSVGTSRATGLSLGAFTTGQRKTIDFRATVPAVDTPRRQLIGVQIGLGV